MVSRLILYEWKKLAAQKAVYVVFAICTLMLFLIHEAYSDNSVRYPFIKSIIDDIPSGGYLLIILPIIVIVARILPIEYELKMLELTSTYKNGRKKIIFIKLLTLFSFSIFVVGYFFFVSGLLSYFKFGMDDLGLSMRALDFYVFFNPNENWTVWQVLLIEFIVLCLSLFAFSVFLFLIARFVHRSVFVMFIGGSLFFLVELLDKYVMRFIGQMKISHYVSFVIDFSINNLLNLKVLHFVRLSTLFALILTISILLIFLNLFLKGPLRND